MKKIVNIDLDGVLNQYSGTFNEQEIKKKKKGAYDFIKKLSVNYEIEIFTVRDKNLTTNWLIENNLMGFIKNVTNEKNKFASVFLDDRAINFNGNFDLAFNLITTFSPYWKQ